MQAVIFAAFTAAALGVDVGWQPVPEGGLEYIIQLDPESVSQMQSGRHVVVGIRPELRDVRRYRVVIGEGPLPREEVALQAVGHDTGSEPPLAIPALASDADPAVPLSTAAARPELLAQATVSASDPIGDRYRTFGDPTTPVSDNRSTTQAADYDWFSERFGGAGSIQVPLLYFAEEGNNPANGSNTSDGWSSAQPVTSNPAPPSQSPGGHGTTLPPVSGGTGGAAGNWQQPAGSNQGNTHPPAGQGGLQPPQQSGQWPAQNPPATGQPQNPYPYQPPQYQPNPAGNPYAGGGQYQVPQQQQHPGYPQQPVWGQPPQGQPAPGTSGVAGRPGVDSQYGTSGQPFAANQSFPLAGQQPPQETAPKEPEPRPWGFLMLALFALFTSMGLNLYLGWNFYDARLRYLDLLDSLRRRGALRGNSRIGVEV